MAVAAENLASSAKRSYTQHVPGGVMSGPRGIADLMQRLYGGFDPGPYFDADWYVSEYPDVARLGVLPLNHYCTFGWRERRDPSPLFNTDWYLRYYPDVAQAGVNPLQHFVRYGMAEGRKPGPLFDPGWYLSQNPDVAAAGQEPLLHYIEHGAAEGRAPKPVPSWRNPEHGVDVLYVSGLPDNTSHLYRVEHQLEALSALGIRAGWIGQEDIIAKSELIFTSRIVIIFRHAINPEIAVVFNEAKKRGVMLLYDIDDYVIKVDFDYGRYVDGIRFINEQFKIWYFDGVRRYNAMALLCHGVIGSTLELAKAANEIGRPGLLIENGFSDKTLAVSRIARAKRARQRRERPDAPVVIGYASGTMTHQKDFLDASNAIARTLRACPTARFVISGMFDLGEFKEFNGLESRVEIRPRVFGTSGHAVLPFEIATYDVNIAPLERDNPFCEAKSNLKYYEAALVGVPTVATPTEPFRRAIEHGRNGYLPADEEQWFTSLTELVNSAELRARVAREATARALHQYGRDAKIAQVKGIFEPLLFSDNDSLLIGNDDRG